MTLSEAALRLLTSPISSLTSSGSSTGPLERTGTGIHVRTHVPDLMRRTSWGSVSESSSMSSSSSADTADTELREWNYRTRRRSSGGATGQDEVERKGLKRSLARERLAERAWREFWG